MRPVPGEGDQKDSRTTSDMAMPSFSIIIPTYQRPDKLASCIQAISLLDYPAQRFEVIVVDDGTYPSDSVESVLEPYRDNLAISLIVQDNAGPASARNTGASSASCDCLAFTDDDCRPRKTWLRALAPHFSSSRECVLGGRAVNALEKNSFSSASQVLVSYICDYYLKRGAPIFPSNNLAVSREVFERIGGFDTRFPLAAGEDREFCDRCLSSGLDLLYESEAVVDHYHHLSLRGFLRQHFNYGRGALFHHRCRASRGSGRIKLEPGKFYTDLIRAPFSFAPHNRPALVSFLLLLSQGANAAGFFWEVAMQRGKKP